MRPCLEDLSGLPDLMGREQGEFFRARALEQMKFFKSGNPGQVGVAVFPDFYEFAFAAWGDIEKVHRNIHRIISS